MAGFDQIVHANLTDVGVRRSHNQDSNGFLLATDEESWRRHGHIYMVADGMGGHAVGEMASVMSVGIIPHIFQKHARAGVPDALRKAFSEANASIHERGEQNPEFKDMGTTTCALVLREDGAWIGHVGDSRIYRIRAGKIEQLTFDHSLLWETARRQGVDPDELEDIKHNVIVRSLGPQSDVQVDVEGPHPIQAGDLFLLCSDGLSGLLSDPEMGAIASVLPPEEACQLLIDLANLRGGIDNITVVIVNVGELETPETAIQKPTARKRRFPWPLAVLFLGVLLAGTAVALFVLQKPHGDKAFLLAVLAILIGGVGLMIHQLLERKQQSKQSHRPRIKVYRQHACEVDQELLDKMRKVESALVQRGRDKSWILDWDTHKQHHKLAERHVARNELPDAFREICRAMRMLTDVLAMQRNKDEVFQPHWDKTGKTEQMKHEG